MSDEHRNAAGSEIPERWSWTTIGELGQVLGGLTKNRRRTKHATKLPYLRVANVYANELKLEDIHEIGVKDRELERVLLEAGDLLVVEGNGSLDQLGRVALWDGSISPCAHQNHLIKVRFPEKGLGRIALYWLLSPPGREQIIKVASSTSGLYNLSLSKVENLSIPIPPKPEQRRIVAEIEKHFSRLDTAVAALERAKANLERYRASVLKAACEGRLVPTEAELALQEGRDYEPAHRLLERILAERRRRWEQAELEKLRAKGMEPKGGAWKKKYKEPEPPSTKGLARLPDGWCWASLDQLLLDLRNGISTPPRDETGISVLRISAVRPLSVDLDDVRFLQEDARSVERFQIKPGDLLFTRYNGSTDLVGVCGRVQEPLISSTLHPDKLIRVRVVQPLVLSSFVEVVSNGGEFRRFIERQTRTTAGQSGISGRDLKAAPVPLAPGEEQERIAARVGLTPIFRRSALGSPRSADAPRRPPSPVHP